MTDRNIALSAEFLKRAGWCIYPPQALDDEYRYWPEVESVGLSGSEPVPDLTTEANLGRVVGIVREADLGHELRCSMSPGEPYDGKAWGGGTGAVEVAYDMSPNIALMTAFIRAKGGTVPDEEHA